MTAREALEQGHLAQAVELQQKYVLKHRQPKEELFLFELLMLAGQHTAARETLLAIATEHENWQATRQRWINLIRAETRRAGKLRRPMFLMDPPIHARRRWNAINAAQRGNTARALHCCDAADATTPEVRGFLDGREFLGIRDTDDRFASVLEVLMDRDYAWIPYEHLRTVRLHAAEGALDVAFRPATVDLIDGSSHRIHLPLRSPDAASAGDEFALAQAVDWESIVDGLVLAVGAKVLNVGEEEVVLSDCRMIEFRG
jgi:type VI secretion system protein ImpE